MMDRNKIIEYRLESGGLAVIHYLRDIPLEDIILNLYLPIKNDPDLKKLVQFYEAQLITAKVNDKKFLKERPKKIREICNWIKKEKKHRLFADFSMFVERNVGERNKDILSAYATSLMDTWVNVAPYSMYWYGLDENDEPLFMPELYGAYDVKAYEMAEQIQRIRFKDHKKAMELVDKMKAYEVASDEIRNNERNITNAIYPMIGIIDKENRDFIFPFDKWFNHHCLSTEFPRVYRTNEQYLNMLDARTYLLHSDGVIVHCYNAGFFQEIRFKEEFLEDGLIVLWRVTDRKEKKHTCGFFDLRNKWVMSPWKFSTDLLNAGSFHEKFVNFLLEVYAHLTCNFEKTTNRLIALKQLDSPEERFSLNVGQPAIYCETNDIEEDDTKERGNRKVTQKIIHKVRPFIRKGNASEIAKANARLYGIVLPMGYTFVREHVRGKIK